MAFVGRVAAFAKVAQLTAWWERDTLGFMQKGLLNFLSPEGAIMRCAVQQINGILIALFVCAALTGCSAQKAYWSANTSSAACEDWRDIGKGCGKGSPEIWRSAGKDRFVLHFVEFDDQGWLHEEAEAAKQIDQVMADLVERGSKKKLSILVYVHGWKHGAKNDDKDVAKFRQLLTTLDNVGPTAREDREVIGIYVGWRGRSWDAKTMVTDPLLNATFWTRKASAIRVAQGDARQLFARVRAFQERSNGTEDRACHPGSGQAADCKVRTLLMGHSFGAWVLYSAISEPLIEALTSHRDAKPTDSNAAKEGQQAQKIGRFADLVVLINPAFESVRYAAVHNASVQWQPSSYRLPILVSVTSKADWATGLLFPGGRYINSLFEKSSGPLQKKAMITTPGHMDEYLTHTLVSEPVGCKDWAETHEFTADEQIIPKKDFANEERLLKQLEHNHKAEILVRSSFFESIQEKSDKRKLWKRQFCGGVILQELEKAKRHTLVWNIQTDKNVIKDHNDFTTPAFFHFMRQLYRDVAFD